MPEADTELKVALGVVLDKFQAGLRKGVDMAADFGKKVGRVFGLTDARLLKLKKTMASMTSPFRMVFGFLTGMASFLGSLLTLALRVVQTVVKTVLGAVATVGRVIWGLAKLVWSVAQTVLRTVLKVVGAVVRVVSRAVAHVLGLTLAVSAALGAMVASAVWLFARLERAMTEVRSLGGMTADQFEAMMDTVQTMAIRFGESSVEMARAMYDIVSASFAGAASVKVLEASVVIAQAGLVGMKTAADVMTTVLNSFGKSAEFAGRVADVLFTIVKRGKTTMQELAPAMGMVTSLARVVGASLFDLGAVMATLTRNGVRTRIAVTAVRAILSALASPTDEATAAFEKLRAKNAWMTAEMSAASVKRMGFTRWLWEVVKASKGNVEVLAELFPNIRALGGVAVLTGKNLRGLVEDYKAMRQSTGAAAEAQAKMRDTLSFQWTAVVRTLSEVVRYVGSVFGPIFKETFRALRKPVVQLLEELKPVFTTIRKEAKALQPMIAEIGDGAVAWVKTQGPTIRRWVEGAFRFVLKAVPLTIDVLRTVYSYLTTTMIPGVQAFYDSMVEKDWAAAWEGLLDMPRELLALWPQLLALFAQRIEGRLEAGPVTAILMAALEIAYDHAVSLIDRGVAYLAEQLANAVVMGLDALLQRMLDAFNAINKEAGAERAKEIRAEISRLSALIQEMTERVGKEPKLGAGISLRAWTAQILELTKELEGLRTPEGGFMMETDELGAVDSVMKKLIDEAMGTLMGWRDMLAGPPETAEQAQVRRADSQAEVSARDRLTAAIEELAQIMRGLAHKAGATLPDLQGQWTPFMPAPIESEGQNISAAGAAAGPVVASVTINIRGGLVDKKFVDKQLVPIIRREIKLRNLA